MFNTGSMSAFEHRGGHPVHERAERAEAKVARLQALLAEIITFVPTKYRKKIIEEANDAIGI